MDDGRFKKGEHRGQATEFKPGQHWRTHKPYWDRDWLDHQYTTLGQSAEDIAKVFGIQDSAIDYWLRKHNIQRRTMADVRKHKHWVVSGPANGMFGKNGPLNPNWKGGISPERAAFYSSSEWKKVKRAVWKRDQRTCQCCGLVYDWCAGTRFAIHHIVSFQNVSLRCVLTNLVLLCRDCHRWVHSNDNTTQLFIQKEVRHEYAV